jgi:hypothetical protein
VRGAGFCIRCVGAVEVEGVLEGASDAGGGPGGGADGMDTGVSGWLGR